METVADLMQPRQVLVLNLLDYVYHLNQQYHEVFQPPEEGLYLFNSVRPIIQANRRYYSESGYRTLTPLTQLDDLHEAVLNENGEVILSRYIMQRKNDFLRSQPNIPSRAVQVAFNIVGMFIDVNTKYTTSNTYENLLADQLLPMHRHLIKEGYLERACDLLLEQISQFINNDLYCVYFIRLSNTELIVEKAGDYRIIEWIEYKQAEHRAANTR